MKKIYPLIAIYLAAAVFMTSGMPAFASTEALYRESAVEPQGFTRAELLKRQSRAEAELEAMNLLAAGLLPAPAPVTDPVEVPSAPEELPDSSATADAYAPTNDPLYSQMWWLQNTRAYQAWDLSRGAGVTIAIIDSGVDASHPDIDGSLWVNVAEANGLPGIDDDGNGYTDDVNGWDFYLENNDFSDLLGHGTHTAGIAAAEGGNATGVVGFAPEARIMALKVFKPTGVASLPDVAQALRYAADMGADVISMSLSFAASTLTASDVSLLQSAVDYAISRGAVVVASAGNQSGDTSQRLPAGFSQLITVGATDASNNLSSYSNFGPGLDLVAPGNNITSLSIVNNGYSAATGTSMAAPMVSGTVALLLAQDPTLDFAGIERRLRYSAKDLGTPGFDNTFGWGLLDAFKALSYDYYVGGAVKTYRLVSPDAAGAVRYDYDTFGRAVRTTFANGGYRVTEYWLGTDNPYTERDYAASGALQVTRRFYENSTVRRTETFANGSVIEYFKTGFRDSFDDNSNGSFSEYANENFYGNGTGRLLRRVRADGSSTRYEGYWEGTDKPRVIAEFSSSGALLDRSEYDLSGDPIVAGSSSTPIITQAISPMNYASVSGPVYNYSGKLVMYSNRSVTYNFTASQSGTYSLKLSTAQATSKTTPSASYKFQFNILVDGQLKASNVLLSATKTYTLSDFMALGILSSGSHTLTLQWTNDQVGATYDANAGIGAVEIYRSAAVAPTLPPACPGDSCEFNAQSDPKKIFYADGRFTFIQYDASGNETGRTEYDSAGIPLGGTPPSAPTLASSLSPVSYAATSGPVYNYSGKLVMYSNRSVTYNFTASQSGTYSLKLSTAQATSKTTPSAAYKFQFNIYVDGQLKVSNVLLSATKTYTLSDFMALGLLSSGSHTLTLQWTNDQVGATYDANAGIGAVEIYRG